MMRTTSWMQPVKLCLGALALGVSAWATAQVAPAAAPAVAPMAHAHGAHHAHPNAHKHVHPKAHKHAHKKGPKHHHHHGHKHGAAHGKAPHHHGHTMATDAGLNRYERNALQRCGVFKEGIDRRACVERVRHGHVSGSVAGGGTITEYTYQVPR